MNCLFSSGTMDQVCNRKLKLCPGKSRKSQENQNSRSNNNNKYLTQATLMDIHNSLIAIISQPCIRWKQVPIFLTLHNKPNLLTVWETSERKSDSVVTAKKKGLSPRFIVNNTRKLNRFGPDAKASSNLKQEG